MCSWTAISGLAIAKWRSSAALWRVSSQAIGVDEREHVQRAQRHVGEVADRRRDDVERGRGILLAGGGKRRRLDEPRSIHRCDLRRAPRVTIQPTTKALGDAAEARALAHLAAAGLVLVRRNYRVARGPGARGGEVDLVMRERDGTLVFVEVRVRRDARFGGAAASVGAAKQHRLVFAATHFLRRCARCRRAGSTSSPSTAIGSSGCAPRSTAREDRLNRMPKPVSYHR